MAEKIIGVLASGRGSNLQAIIDNIANDSLKVKIGVVICDQPDAYAIERAQKAGIPTRSLERKLFASKDLFEQAINSTLLEYKVELIVLAGFMRLLGSTFIKNWQYKIMNIHPSLLPSFPGLHPQMQALDYGAKVSGCTVHFVDEGMDTGPIIMQQAVHVLDEDNEASLSARILQQEHVLYAKAIAYWAEGKLKLEGRKVVINT